MQIRLASKENNIKLPQKIKNETAVWPSNSTFGFISEETHYTNLKVYMHPCVHCSIIYNNQDVEAT